jgi:hypothetical protein
MIAGDADHPDAAESLGLRWAGCDVDPDYADADATGGVDGC